MELPNDMTGAAKQRGPAPTSVRSTEFAGKRAELVSLLLKKKVPGKHEILRVKALIRELAGQPEFDRPGQANVKEFVSAYLDLYLGRMTGDATIERAGLRRCLDCLGTPEATAAPEDRSTVPE